MTDDAIPKQDVRRALEKVDAAAAEEHPDRAGAMRRARLIVEKELLR